MPVFPVENWSAAADFNHLIVEHIATECPDTIVECGSGLSTLMLAKSCEHIGKGHVFSLDCGDEFADSTRDAINYYNLGQYATVLHAPLVDYQLGDDLYQWYALDDLTVERIDMLVIDGPPAIKQKHARYPAIPLLFNRLLPGSHIFMDDAERTGEREIVELWKEAYSELDVKYLDTERGCAKLSICSGAD